MCDLLGQYNIITLDFIKNMQRTITSSKKIKMIESTFLQMINYITQLLDRFRFTEIKKLKTIRI